MAGLAGGALPTGRPGARWGIALAALFILAAPGGPHPAYASCLLPAVRLDHAFADPDTLTPWFAGLHHQREFIASSIPQWTDWTLSQAILVRDLNGGAVGGEVFQAERFGLRDVGVALDVYRELWARSYGNIRLRMTPQADALPRWDLRMEGFQAFAGGWEISGSYWRMDFEDDDVNVLGVGGGKYHGLWYLRATTTLSTLAERSALSYAGMIRRFVGTSKEYVEVSGGIGREVVVLGPGPVVDVRDTRFFQARVQRFLNARWGFAAGFAHNRFEGAPERNGVSIGLITRF